VTFEQVVRERALQNIAGAVNSKGNGLKVNQAGWFMPVIPATWEVEIRRMVVLGQPG
jgi:hypothetical protein